MKAICAARKKRADFVGLSTLVLALSLVLVAGYCSASLYAAAALPASAIPFYKGKTIRVIVPVSAGGSFDVWSRILARHMGKHISGNPSFVVQNMTGGGGVVGANYLYGIAKPDGLTIGTISPNGYLNQLMQQSEAKYDWAKYRWIGATATTHELLYVRADAGYRTLDDVIKAATPPVCSSIGVGTTGSFIPRLLQELFGARFKIVEGYPGGVESDMAVARGEVNCRATSITTYFGREPTKGWHEQGFTRVLIQTGEKRHPALPEAPSVWELAERKMLPNGDRRVMEVILAGGGFGVPFVAPPAIPAEHLKLLREAFTKTLDDEEFRADVARVHGFEVRPVNGHELEKLARRIIDLPPNVAARLRQFLSS
jgi:tripartite-type tricarboxylate transporter receptor subunit TctC